MSDVPDFSDVRESLEAALSWRAGEQSAWAEQASQSWGYSVGWASPHRPDGFERYRGAARAAKIVRGQPPHGESVKTVVGFDADDRVVLVRHLDDGRLVREAVMHHEPLRSVAITLMEQYSAGRGPEHAYLDEYRDVRVWRTSVLGPHTSGVVQTEFVYDDAGRLIEEIERREHPFDDGGYEQRLTMLYGDDGEPEALLAGPSVEWRRRAKSAEVKNAAVAAEDALVRALAGAARREPAPASPLVVWLRHQDDGAWVDQAMPEVSVTALETSRNEWSKQWGFESWDVPSLEYRTVEVVAALDQLDDVSTPGDGEARQLLIRVATRLRGLREFPGGTPAPVVTGFDPPSLTRQIESSAGADCTQRLRVAGWLPSL